MAEHQSIKCKDGEGVRVSGPAQIRVIIPRGKNAGRRVKLVVIPDKPSVERVKRIDVAPPEGT